MIGFLARVCVILTCMPSYLNRVLNLETIAAIDLGSNALRAIIARKNGDELEVVKSFREPLRLGEDVFHTGLISEEKMIKTEEAFIKLFHIFTEYNVTDIRAMATSAMRDSKNGSVLAKRIAHATGIEIETIRGNEEAEIIFQAVKQQINLKKKNAILMDIGGGSTELIIVRDERVVAVESFNVGTVRLMKLDQVSLEKKISEQIETMLTFIKSHLKVKDLDLFIGTGGNLRRIGKIRKKILGRPTSEMALFSEIHHMEESILSMSYVERIRRLELDQNRADVILPAIMLTHHLMEKLKLEKIYLPKVGLKEGIVLSMLETPPKRLILKD
jgi:exopolyphosphatase/guanosine-5'-triphosphate,3'-diphosphate pyrophosphatase